MNEKFESIWKSKKTLFLGKYDEQKVLQEIKSLLEENEEIKAIAKELRKDL